MLINRDQLIKRLAEKSGFYQKHIQVVLHALDEVIMDCFDEVTEDEEMSVQIAEGIKITGKIQGERQRVDPRTHKEITCCARCKPGVKFSEPFKRKIQKQYEEKQG